MKTIGQRSPPPVDSKTGCGISQTSQHTQTLLSLSGGRIWAPKGVFRYQSHEQANAHQAQWIAKTMAALEVERSKKEGFTRPATESDLLALLNSLNQKNVPYLLIGGFALAAHGYIRATVDIDIMLPASPESGSAIKEALLLLPDQAAKDLDPAWLSEGENIRINDAFTIDLMLNANGYRYEDLVAFEETIEWHSVAIKTISLEGLALTKRTLRAKDQEDLAVIEAAIAARQTVSENRQYFHG